LREVEGPLATIFYTNGFKKNQCHHDRDPCIHAFDLKELEPYLYAVEIDEEVTDDSIIKRWEDDLDKYGWKILHKADTSSEAGQWSGSCWILRLNRRKNNNVE
jgi:hypothetical protein